MQVNLILQKDMIYLVALLLKYYKNFLQAGFISIEPKTGYIKSWVGGINHKYFKYVVPFTSRLSRPFKNIYTYAFSMNPINVEPSGSLDFTQLRSNRTTLDVKMVPNLTETYNLHMYYVGYQTFTFENGFMTLAY